MKYSRFCLLLFLFSAFLSLSSQRRRGVDERDKKSKPSSRFEFIRTLEKQMMQQYIREDLRKLIEKKDYERRKTEGKLTEAEKEFEAAKEEKEEKEEEKEKDQLEKEKNQLSLKEKEEERKKKLLEDDASSEIQLKLENSKILKELVHEFDFSDHNPSGLFNKEILTKGLDAFKSRGFTPAELYIIEKSANKFTDPKISHDEWMEFYKVFIQPFEENCNPNDGFKVLEKDISQCMKQPELNFVRKVHSSQSKLLEKSITNFMRLERFQEITFPDYVLVRRAQTAIRKCGSKNGIGKANFGCALQISVPRLDPYSETESGRLFELANAMRSNLQDNVMFVDFLSLALLSKYLSWDLYLTAGLPSSQISANKFKEAAEVKEFPFEVSAPEIQHIFKILGVDELNTSDFIALMYSFGLIKQNRINSEFFMCSESWRNLMNDPNFNQDIVNNIDNSQAYGQSDILSGSGTLDPFKKENADDNFIISFLERSQRMKSNDKISEEEKDRRRQSVYKIVGIPKI